MASYSTKLKVGRKLEGVDTDTASDNQVSLLLRYDEGTGAEDHVSVSIESDAITVEDVFALLDFLDDRGILTSRECKTWLHQSKASREEHGETTEWAGEDLEQKVSMAKKGLRTRSGGQSGGGERARKQALVKVNELESDLDELKDTLRGGEADDEDEADESPATGASTTGASSPDSGSDDDGPTPPNAL
jgi:hypothetical protein